MSFDPTKPVETMDGRRVEIVDATDDKFIKGKVFHRDGPVDGLSDHMTVFWIRSTGQWAGSLDGRYNYDLDLRNVEISLFDPVETVNGFPVTIHNLYGSVDGSAFQGTVDLGSGNAIEYEWDKHGRVIIKGCVSNDSPMNIRNVDPAVAQERAFRAMLTREGYGSPQVVMGEDYSFTRPSVPELGKHWTVWAMDEFVKIDKVPGYIPDESIDHFWKWCQARDEDAWRRGEACGEKTGRHALAAEIREAKARLARLESGFPISSPDERFEYDGADGDI